MSEVLSRGLSRFGCVAACIREFSGGKELKGLAYTETPEKKWAAFSPAKRVPLGCFRVFSGIGNGCVSEGRARKRNTHTQQKHTKPKRAEFSQGLPVRGQHPIWIEHKAMCKQFRVFSGGTGGTGGCRRVGRETQ